MLRKKFRLISITEYFPENATVKVSNGVHTFSVPIQILGIEYRIPDLNSDEDRDYLSKIQSYISTQSTFAIAKSMVCLDISCSNELYRGIAYMNDKFIAALANNEAVHVGIYESNTDSYFYLPVHMVEFL